LYTLFYNQKQNILLMGDVAMKEIIYLDTMLLHSYVSQYNDGLPNTSSLEQTQEINDTTEIEEGYNSRSSITAMFNTGKFEIPMIFSTPEGKVEGVFQPGNFNKEKAVMSQTEMGKEIISKQLHDNALVNFEKYLEDNELFCDLSNPDIEGNFIKMYSEFQIIDFAYLSKIIQPDKLLKFSFSSEEEEITKFENELKKEKDSKQKSLKKAKIQQIKNQLTQEKNRLKNQFEFINESLVYLNEILPTESFVKMHNVIAPLKYDFLREKSSELMFKYGNNNKTKATLIGKVTNIIKTVDMPNLEKDPFFEFPKVLTGVLYPLGVINVNDLIVSPVAIYFE
jgi:hypothetical protein